MNLEFLSESSISYGTSSYSGIFYPKNRLVVCLQTRLKLDDCKATMDELNYVFPNGAILVCVEIVGIVSQ